MELMLGRPVPLDLPAVQE
ncbi:hypothetical protein [Streptomyces sp. NPDC016845]